MNYTNYINSSNNNHLTNFTDFTDFNNFHNFHNFHNYNEYSKYNSNSSMLYNQVLTMTVIPLITTVFTTFFTILITDIKKIIGNVINYYSLKFEKKKIIQYDLYKNNEINKDIIPLIWYINKTNSIKEGNMMYFNEIINKKTKIDMLLCPIFKESNENSNPTQNLNHKNNEHQQNEKKQNNSNKYLFEQINDDKKLFYYGINSNNFCLMSYHANIQELGEYILDIKNQYLEYKSDISVNIIKNKKIYIELYSKSQNDSYSRSQDIQNINNNVIPLIWYLNNKKIINHGILMKISQLSQLSDYDDNKCIDADNSSLIKMNKLKKSNNLEIIIMPFVEENKNCANSSNDKTNDVETSLKNEIKSNDTNNSIDFIEVDKHIFCAFILKKNKSIYYSNEFVTKEYVVIQSEKYSINELVNWLDSINIQYSEYIKNTNKIQYLYTYTSGEITNKFVKSMLDKTQTFEHLFFEKKNEIIDDIKNFTNVEYYQKFGLKRKLGYLLVGPPGCGKSALVTAITNELGRSLKNIPISLVKTNNEFEKAYGDFNYDNQSIKSNEIVITFDEIDSAYDSQKLIKNVDQENSSPNTKNDSTSPIIIINTDNKNNNESNSKNFSNINSNKDDKLNIGVVLSKLDGNENQEGLVIIATCNDMSKLDPALYRNGRLKLIELKYAGQIEIGQMIEKYCENILSNEQKNKIRNDCLIQTLNIKHLIAEYLLKKKFVVCSDDINEIIKMINLL